MKKRGAFIKSARIASNDRMQTGGGSDGASAQSIAMVEQFARLDLHRRERTGIPEAVLAEGKTIDQLVAILTKLAEPSGLALATRVTAPIASILRKRLKKRFAVDYCPTARTLVVQRHDYKVTSAQGRVGVLAAGTADVAVAEEAAVTAELMGATVLRFYDVGIAGLHRLVEPLRRMKEADVACVVVAAGMEGALPSVVRGLVSIPVIGVPVSTGYGYGGKGEAALMTMLQSCAPGLTVVNIDNGFGAGATAALIANQGVGERANKN